MVDCENDPGWQYLRRSREQMLADQSTPYDSKKNVWVPDDEEGYIGGIIKSAKGDTITVAVREGHEVAFKKEQVQEMNPPKFEKTEDMSNLTFLNDASVLHNLRARYGAMLIYTYSGLFCVVINPYKRLPIYTDSVARMFMGKRRTEMPPHLFAVSDEAYRNMLQDHENQSMLITGESGAGKTENTKKVIAYFASVGASQQEAATRGQEVTEKKVTLEDQIVQTNPVLEAFGNAKTVRNNNSSRFGKFIRIHFSKQGRVASCDIEHYLLEKSRVIRQAPGERCYHIFYQVFSEFVPGLKQKLLLDKPLKDYWFVAQAELQIDGVNDKEEHQLTDEAFDILNFSPDEKMNTYKLVSAMMHMGNMKFKQRPREEQAEPDGTEEAEKASKMYGIEVEEFLKALTRPRVKVGNEWVNKGQNCEQVAWAVGAMAKGLYSRIFHWLVKKCNMTLDQQGISRDYFIGVLDIAGFEIFDFNSFEQLWINFVNEKLQQFFNHHMFVLEQEEYKREGIDWVFIDFGLDLQACIELIEKPLGIISILDEECIVPKASDITLAQKFNEQHLGKHPNFVKPAPPKGKQAEAHFAMKHYAGTVRYNVLNWLEKNKDPLNDTVVQCMKLSKDNTLLLEVWCDYTTQEEAAALQAKSGGAAGGKKKGKSGSFMTVSMMYRESLNNLMTMLHQTHPHFIRCIIPNEKKQSGMIDAALVLNQLTCNGVLEGIRICRKGFPNRTLHPDFVQRYALLAADEKVSSPEPKVAATNMLNRLIKEGKLKDENFRVGATKVFFKAGVLAHLEDLRDERLAYLMQGLQAQVRWYYNLLERRRRAQRIEALKKLQRTVRNWITLRTWEWFKLLGKIKPLLREGKVEEEMNRLTEAVTTLQDTLTKEEELKKAMEEGAVQLADETAELLKQLEASKGSNKEIEERVEHLNQAKAKLEQSLSEASSQLSRAEEDALNLQKARKRVEGEAAELKKNQQDLDISLRKSEADKQTKENQIRSLQDELRQQEENAAKLQKEKRQQEDVAKKLAEDLSAAEERNVQAQKLRQKLQQSLEEAEATLDRERRNKQDMDKQKRKAEGDLKIAHETMDDINKARADIESNLRRRENEMHAMNARLEEEQAAVAKLQRQMKDDDAKSAELGATLDEEKEARQRADRARQELQQEYDDMLDQLDEQQRSAATQVEAGKKKDVELSKLRRDLEESGLKFQEQLAALKKKGTDAVFELNDQIEHVQKAKARADKEKAVAQRELDDISSRLDQEAKARMDAEKLAKAHEVRLLELKLKAEEQARQIQDYASTKSRLHNENSELTRQVEELEAKINAAARLKTQFSANLDETKKTLEIESRDRQNLLQLSKQLQRELEQLRESVDDEAAAKNDVARLVSKGQTELEAWKAKFESEGLIGADELDDVKKRQTAKLIEIQTLLDAANAKITQLENAKNRIAGELDVNRLEAEHHAAAEAVLEKKQKAYDKVIEDWKKKVDDLHVELDQAQRDARQLSAEAHKLRGQHDSMADQAEGLRRENKALSDEMRDLSEQLGEGGRAIHTQQKNLRRLEIEKDELQRALDEAEAALESEESKAARAQVEVAQIRAEIEKRLSEKEEEFENTRKIHQTTIDSITATLEQEARGKADLLRIRKKLEADIQELEIALEHANAANADAQKNIINYSAQIKELQATVEEESRRRESFREAYAIAERKLAAAKSEQEDLIIKLDAIERSRRQTESQVHESHEHNNELNAQNVALAAAKAQLESEIGLLKADVAESKHELEAAEERGKRAALEAARLAEDLRRLQEESAAAERLRKNLESQIKEMQERADAAEAAVLKGGAKAVAKAEHRLKVVQSEYENEVKRGSDAQKAFVRADRRVRELDFQVSEDRKNYEKLQELVEKLNTKLRQQKKQLEEAEEQATGHLAKYRQVQVALEAAEERADTAESTLTKMRTRARASSVAAAQRKALEE